MDVHSILLDDQLDPPSRIFERLRQLAGYTWDETKPPFHSSYDQWHFFGTRFVSPYSVTGTTPVTPPVPLNVASPSSLSKLGASTSSRPSLGDPSVLSPPHSEFGSEHSITSPPTVSPSQSNVAPVIEEEVVARVSYHVLREERAFHIAKGLISTADPDGEHIVKPLDLIRLSPAAGDRGPIIVAIYQHPGPNFLFEILDMGPAHFWVEKTEERWEAQRNHGTRRYDQSISLKDFMDFAIGATQCLEMIHHGQGIVHGEIRGDAFHYNIMTNKVKLTSFGSGVRSFEHGLTSTGWSSLSKELGAKNKLLYISPEQTGRMPEEPDTRTDVYSLGVVFWTLLTGQPVFDGDSPLDIVQGVLGRKIPIASAVRLDVPDVLGRIIQKCTAKNVADRYHSASGLRYDLIQVQQFMCAGNLEATREWRIASRDVSSFFMLPTIMIGREKERAELIRVIDRVAKSHAMNQKGAANRFSDGSSLSNDWLDGADVSSEGASSVEGTTRRSGSFAQIPGSDPKSRNGCNPSSESANDAATVSSETISSNNSTQIVRAAKPWERHQSVSFDTKSLADGVGADSARYSSTLDSPASSLSRQLGSAKFRRRGQCEIVTIEGTGGLGKSCLVQSVFAEARRRGYCSTAKFDTARRTAFGPLLSLLGSLFRQVWGERNTETPFHQTLKQYVRPVWPTLHKVLGLPEFLLGPVSGTPISRALSNMQASSVPNKHIRVGMKRRGSSPDSPSSSVFRNARATAQSPQDFLRLGAQTKTMRLMNTFLDILRLFASHKFICFCLDDLHVADAESLDLITQIIGARLKMVILVTYRPDELSPERVQEIISPPELEEFPRPTATNTTRILLEPLGEEEIVQYVSTTLCRPKEEVLPLALVIQSKTAGNPFYMREMLTACNRKKCIWYDYRDGRWVYDLDRLFDQFQGEENYDVLDTNFITRRLSELPPASRSILAWGALLGQTFSFDLVCKLLGGDFQEAEDFCQEPLGEFHRLSYSQQEAVAGLQAAIQAYILVPSERDDQFRFAHDRYIQAASALKGCNARRMHFVISQTLLKHHGTDPKYRDSTAAHVCEAVDIIKKRVSHRQPYRKLLLSCAEEAAESGARPTAAKYYSNAVALLQSNPWDVSAEDVSYDETIQLYLRAAECYLYMGHSSAAHVLLQNVFNYARTALDKAPAWVLQSRISAQSGNSKKALETLRQCLKALGIDIEGQPTYESCDKKFERLQAEIQAISREKLVSPAETTDSNLASVGAVMAETVSAAWWSDCLYLYHLTMVMMKIHLTQGASPQSGLVFLHFAIIAMYRFNMVQFGVDLANVGLELLDKFRDPYTLARGHMVFASYISHVQYPISYSVSQLDTAVDYAAASGDRTSAILSFGLSAQAKFFASENCADLEAFCQYGCEEIPNWHLDTRGGTGLISVRQVCRALQGKTRALLSADDVMSDEQHNAGTYKAWLSANTNNDGRSLLVYHIMEIIPLFLYGHYERAVEIGQACYRNSDRLWTSCGTRLAMLFYGLALAGQVLRRQQDPRPRPYDLDEVVEQTVRQVAELNNHIKDWQVVNNVNYLAWSKLLDAQMSEVLGDHGRAIHLYEEALDHASEHSFVFEEALGNYLMSNIFVRNSARRSARSALRDAVGLYRQLGATGIADRIEAEHSILLHGPIRNPCTIETGVQTDFAGDAASVQYRNDDGDDEDDKTQGRQEKVMAALKGERTSAWRGSMQIETAGTAGLPALDMIDLHAILVSSQVISSVLRIDELLKTMCDVILQTCGGSATQAAIVVQDEGTGDWCVAASGDPEHGAEAHMPGILLAGTPLVAENVVLYCTRFREIVFLRDIVNDERFGNVNESWSQRNPNSKAIIAIPISRGSESLLGVLYLEGVSGSFTDRNVTVLQLLVNQIGISYSNALAMKAVEKVSAENVSMVELQKRALAKAIEAEAKAKDAEAEAKRNVKLAEEAAKAKSIFLANVSHELRTPLNGVIGNSELLRDSNLNKDQMEMADSIRVSADLLLAVINDILDFSRMEADKMKLYMIAFNPEEMVREVVRAASYSNREKASKKNVKIIQDINLPAMLIYGDPIRLHQVLGNLISNSLKFTEDGSITIGARVDSETRQKAALTFWVKDTGIGISSEQLAKLFQPFSQADASTARKYGGSGLGLSICKSLIETMMKGKIKLESQVGTGTTAWFTVTFEKARPEVVAGDAQKSAAAAAPNRNEAATRTSNSAARAESPNPYMDLARISKTEMRIAVAEDNIINARIATQYLTRLGYHNIDTYDNGQKAVEGLRLRAREGLPYHIILMDVQMPFLDGYEATKLLRMDPLESVRKVLVIAMTASAIQGDREKCLAAGMNDYLAKPVRSDVLRKKLEAYTGPGEPERTASDLASSACPNSSSSSPSPAAPLRAITSTLNSLACATHAVQGPTHASLPARPQNGQSNVAPTVISTSSASAESAQSATDSNPLPADDSVSTTSSKRHSRKLVKKWSGSDAPAVAAPTERPKNVLQKRISLRQQQGDEEGAQSGENAPMECESMATRKLR